MRIAVIGGTGDLGALVVAELAARGDAVRAVSRTAPPVGTLPPGVEQALADLTSGAGLRPALDGIEAVVDAANDRARAREVLVDGTRRLAAAAAAAGVAHHLGVSVVGCDRVPMAYYDAKVAQEQALADGATPWTLLRATQFHTLVAAGLAAVARWRVLPSGRIPLQPIDPALVARRLADALHAAPAGRLPDLAGPRVESLGELAAAWRAAHRPRERLLALPIPPLGKAARAMRDGGLTEPAAAATGSPTFAQWLAQR
jgi:uncharacterized protein YbjT (DUF2867 family)